MKTVYEFVMESGKRERAEGIDEFNAFLTMFDPTAAERVDYYGIVTDSGLRDIHSGTYFCKGLLEVVNEIDAQESQAIDELIAASLDVDVLSLSEIEPNLDPSSHAKDPALELTRIL